MGKDKEMNAGEVVVSWLILSTILDMGEAARGMPETAVELVSRAQSQGQESALEFGSESDKRIFEITRRKIEAFRIYRQTEMEIGVEYDALVRTKMADMMAKKEVKI